MNAPKNSNSAAASSRYTPGYSKVTIDFMQRRTADTHARFFAPFIKDDIDLLDVGCGPGSITRSLAARYPKMRVIGLDSNESQIELAREQARNISIGNVQFQTGDTTKLPFEDASFDRLFCHALLEHLENPEKAVAEFFRVLRPGGVLGLCSPDWAGFLLGPPTEEVERAVAAYRDLQTRNGGNVFIGRSLGSLLVAAGFLDVEMRARYEVYAPTSVITDYLASQLETAGDATSADALQSWAKSPASMFAQAWVSAIGRKAGGGGLING